MKRRLMIVNVYFAPDSFGGATVVAEQMAWRLAADWEILVVTTSSDTHLPPLHCSRYRVNQVDVVAVNLHPGGKRIDQFMNPYFSCVFSGILASFHPDAVHFHCIQGMGAEMLHACVLAGIPLAVTVHDNWWICERQFMINKHDQYCFQETVDLSICRQCVQDLEENHGALYGNTLHRAAYLSGSLLLAKKVLFPSVFQRNLYEKNIMPLQREQFVVNKNGVQLPSASFRKKNGPAVRFGFVGGIGGGIKGFALVEKAFAALDPSRYQLVVVDNTLNLGYSSITKDGLSDALHTRVVPAYTQETMDEFFAEIDVLLFPSQWKESFGLTVREALVRDVWVICTDGGGTVEDIVDGENGTVIPLDGDWRTLQKAVERVLKMDIRDYSNPYRERIMGFDEQAEELHNILSEMETVA